MSKLRLYRMVWVPSAILLTVLTGLYSRPSTAKPEIGPMTAYTTEDKSLTVSHPENWKPHESGANAVLTRVRFTPTETVRVTVTTDLTGSLFADIQKSSTDSQNPLAAMGMGTPDKQKSPLENVHEMQGKQMAEDPSYGEFQDGNTQKLQVAGTEALMTDFTYKKTGLFGMTEMVGERVTALAGERRLTFVAVCPKQMGTELAQVFQKMLESLRVGQAGG